jgi:hypothetical protein
MVDVHGTVARNGQPMSAGKVLFSPLSDGEPAAGIIQPDGTFQLSTHRENDGALIGKYRVAILGGHTEDEYAPRMIFTPPEELTIDVRPGQDNDVKIDIREDNGWRAARSN